MKTESNSDELEGKINSAIEEIYKDVGLKCNLNAESVYFSGRCEDVSPALVEKLNKEGFRAKLVHYGGWDITSHEFVLIDDTLVVDPTWQQFLSEPDPNLPRVLICDVSKLDQVLEKLSLQDKKHIWQNLYS